MRASVIVRSKDEAGRLRLTLASLVAQSSAAEIVVVNDGSTDHTDTVLAEVASEMPAGMKLLRIDHATPLGRSGAANAGAGAASGDILIFLDGDTLAAPDFVETHLALHRSRTGLIARGETYHLRCTRFFADPESGSAQSGNEARLARLSELELDRMRVTRADIASRFSSIDSRAQPGVYPGAGPRRLYDLEMDALISHPDCSVLWAAASGSNQSVRRADFLSAGGFDPKLSINEHRELALRLCQAGLRMVPASARTYHLTHRSGWRDPLADNTWESVFYRAHPISAVPLLSVLWASLSDSPPFPSDKRITSLPALERAARSCTAVSGVQAVRAAHFANGQVCS